MKDEKMIETKEFTVKQLLRSEAALRITQQQQSVAKASCNARR